MNLVQMQKDLQLVQISRLTSHQIDHVTCLECCKYYIAPETAACGHTLCHTCWRGRRTCPVCAASLDRKSLKINLQLQTLTKHVQALGEAFEKLFNMKLDEFNLDTPDELGSEKDPDRNVKDWLTSSQNHFSAPIVESQQSSEEHVTNPLEISASNIQIHANIKKPIHLPKVIHIPPPQHDWDKIEPMPDPDVSNKNKENIVGPMDIEPFFLDDTEYTSDKPRRSSRKRDLKNYDHNVQTHDLPTTKQSSRDSSGENERSEKSKQTWSNVKKMRKEFSKLNKKNKSKLNVSIEMVKKTHNVKQVTSIPAASTPQNFNIDDNTPYNTNKETGDKRNNEHVDHVIQSQSIVSSDCNINKQISKVHPDNLSVECTKNNDILNVNDTLKNKSNEKHDLQVSQNKTIKISVCTEEGDITKKIQNKSNNDKIKAVRLPFIKKSGLAPRNKQIFNDMITSDNKQTSTNTDDIEITIKIGTTIANILITKKERDIQVKVNNDREVQTSLNNDYLINEQSSKNSNKQNIEINVSDNISTSSKRVDNEAERCTNIQPVPNLERSASTKKNTASAETATAQFEITESVEKELSNIMECAETSDEKHDDKEMCSIQSTKINTPTQKPSPVIQSKRSMDQIEIDRINDLDIFGSGSVKDSNVQHLKEPAHSEILMSTIHSKFKTQKIAEKRNRDYKDDELLPNNKKIKTTQKNDLKNDVEPDSEPINYDTVINQVFANIDADIEEARKSQHEQNTNSVKVIENDEYTVKQTKTVVVQTQETELNENHGNEINIGDAANTQDYFNQKQSENVFSITEKEYDNIEIIGNVETTFTPVLYRNLNVSQESQTDNSGRMSKSRRKSLQDNYDSDKSVVEETPQKNVSFVNLKRASTSKIHQSQEDLVETKKIESKYSTRVKSVVNLTDSISESNKSSKDVTVVNTIAKKTLDTPLTISKFADQIKHKSTPVAKKSLNFDNEDIDDDDPEQTLCPTSSIIAKTTQEKEFLRKAFEKTPTVIKPVITRNFSIKPNRKLCLAGSCLPPQDITKLKYLCNESNWTYVDKYTKELTHLVVGVDEENKSQRSVKYMCALAASKWIVSFEWIKKCLLAKGFVDEENFEALDSTGEPGPKRSRIAKKKLFEGITFYCMPPFSVLDVDTLKNMLVAAGGRVVNATEEVRVSPNSQEPALLLAEPEHTQEDRFIYLTMELSVVPVNYEWVLNCLGSYTLSSIQELLLCPSSLLPPGTSNWPEVLLAQDYD